MTLYVHIGVPKTGTTSIQTFLKTNAAALKERGLLVPPVFRGPNHTELYGFAVVEGTANAAAVALARSFVPDAAFGADFVDAVRSHNGDAVVSCEYLSDRLSTVEAMDRLARLLRAACDNVRVVLYIRDQVEALASYYPTQVLGGRRSAFAFSLPANGASWSDHCAAIWAAHEKGDGTSAYVDALPGWLAYDELVERWEHTFGRDRIIIRPFRKSCDIVGDFFQALGISDLSRYELVARANQARGAYEIEAIRRLNRLFPRLIGNAQTAERSLVFSKLAGAVAGAETGPTIGPSDIMLAEEIREARAYFAVGNAKISAVLDEEWNEPSGTVTFRNTTESVNDIFGRLLIETARSELKVRQANESLRCQVVKLREQHERLKAAHEALKSKIA